MVRGMFFTQTVPFGRKDVLIQGLPQTQCFELKPSKKTNIPSTVAKALKNLYPPNIIRVTQQGDNYYHQDLSKSSAI